VLSPLSESIYVWALSRGGIAGTDRRRLAVELDAAPVEVARGISALTELRLLTPAADEPGTLVPSSPDVAAAELVNPVKLEVMALERRASELEAQFSTLGPLYARSRQARVLRDTIEIIDGVDRVHAILRDIADRCTTEVLGAHPGTLPPQSIDSWLEPLSRDVRVRLLFQHPVRVNGRMRAFLGRLVEAGYEVRTCEEITGQVVIFDREAAVIAGRPRPSGAVALRETSTVDYLRRGLEQDWDTALPFDTGGSAAPCYGIAAEAVKRAVLQLLATGAKDEQIARRLSLSVRTCRRHIAEIMAELEVSSRFQAGVRATRLGLLTEAPTTDAPADTSVPRRSPGAGRPRATGSRGGRRGS